MLVLSGILMLLAVMLVAVVLWKVFSTQIKDGYEKRLATSLSVLELALDRGISDFRSSLSRLATDNTLRVTLDLDIRPQLKRYLSEQFGVSDFRSLTVLNPKGEVVARLGKKASRTCDVSATGTTESISTTGQSLLLVRTVPLRDGGRTFGYLCGGFALNGDQMVRTVSPRLDGFPLLGWNDNLVPFGEVPTIPSLTASHTGFFQLEASGTRFMGEAHDYSVGENTLRLFTLVDMRQYQELLEGALKVTGFVVIAILIVGGFALRMLKQRQLAMAELREERQKAEVTLASIAEGVITLDRAGKITYINPAATRILGSTPEQTLGHSWKEIFGLQDEATGDSLTDIHSALTEQAGQGAIDAILVTAEGQRIAVHFSAARIKSEGAWSGSVITFRDMHKERELRRNLAWRASRDELTGLLNRAEFHRSLEDILASAEGGNFHHCLLYIDLDEFKVINDTCGHQAGDEVLKQISAGLKTHLRESDIIARLGGDEFGVILCDCGRDKGVSVAEGLIEAINDLRFSFRDRVFHVGASIGLISVTGQTRNLEDLLSTVDAACYAAKERGRNRVYAGTVGNDKISHRMEEMRQASHIRQALKEGRLTLYRQSIVSSRHPADPLHFEVLVRMIDTEGNLVVPGAFIPVAERHGLMGDVDRWIIRHLFDIEGDRLRRWTGATGNDSDTAGHFLYSVNLSAASLTDPDFLDFVTGLFRQYEIPPQSIAFEITETQAITHLDKATHLIQSLREIGCQFLLDDFGSGMSSFGYLKKLPVDYLKIDGLFVRDILTDPIDRAMVNMINDIGHIMNLTTVAEFVENDEVLHEIRELGVDLAQGYGISRPEPIETPPLARRSSIA